MQKPSISVIVPIYNAEPYLSKCLDSIIAQVFQDFELILVNDGSTDKSLDIINKYIQKDNRLKLINKENGGVSQARQSGLNLAEGKYVIHADPDDTVSPFWLQHLYEKAIQTDADMVICGFLRIFRSESIPYYEKPSSLDSATILQEMLEEKLWGVTWNKLIRRSCFAKYKIKFHPQMSFCEDLYVTCKLLGQDIKVAHVNELLYNYDCVINTNSIVRLGKSNHSKSLMIMIDELEDLFPDKRYLMGFNHQKLKAKIRFLYGKDIVGFVNTYPECNDTIFKLAKKSHPWVFKNKGMVLMLKGHPKLGKFYYYTLSSIWNRTFHHKK